MSIKKGEDVQKFFVSPDWGRQEIAIQPGTHTVMVDTVWVRQKAIAEFLSVVTDKKVLSSHDLQKLIGVAVGIFDVPLRDLYDETFTMDKLGDVALADVLRYKMESGKIEL